MHYEIALAGLFALLGLYYLVLYRQGSTVCHIIGPSSPSWLFGHMLQLILPHTYGDYEFEWLKLYGLVYRLKGCFGQDRLMISDPVALQHILNNPHQFKPGPNLENIFHLVYGERSVISASGDYHKRLRAALNPGFSAAAVRSYLPVFEKAAQKLTEQLEDSCASSMNVCPLFSIATLSTMSEAVLGYSTEELGEEFISNNAQIITLSASQSAAQILADAIGARMPTVLLRAAFYLPTQMFKDIRKARYLADELGNRVVREKENAARQGLEVNTDVFGQLVEQHRSDKTKNSLTEAEIVAQTEIIMVAGQDTTACTLAFGVLELAKAPEFQDKLRAEIHSTVSRAPAGTVAYDSMPLLNAFIKEVLRLYPAEPMTDRMAVQDTVIPLARSITTSMGEHLSHIPVRKGQIVTLAIASYQRLQSRWGEDAHKFNPTRWLDTEACKGEAVGPYANLLSFIGGPRTCLGWRFAILEMQVFLCELVGKFSFAPSPEGPVHAHFANTLMPALANGQKGALLLITRIV
ncbi:cytochrome P450 [Mycena galopus ATCC 62051]|nr:cytochrome P450 [Mycena galopus ATCC 62051]